MISRLIHRIQPVQWVCYDLKPESIALIDISVGYIVIVFLCVMISRPIYIVEIMTVKRNSVAWLNPYIVPNMTSTK